VRFAEKKKKFEEGLAKDIMNQFMAEVVKENDAKLEEVQGPKGAWAKKSPSPLILKKTEEPLKSAGEQSLALAKPMVNQIPSKVQGKWKDRVQKSNSNLMSEHSIGLKDQALGKSPLREQKTTGTPGNHCLSSISKDYSTQVSIHGHVDQAIDLKDTASELNFSPSGKYIDQERPEHPLGRQSANTVVDPDARQLNKWHRKPVTGMQGPAQYASQPTSNHQKSPLQPGAAGKKQIVANVLEKGLEEGGNANQILKVAAKKLGKVDPELAMKAEEFFFDKIGAALLNNFKNNLTPCGHCGRKFDPRSRILIQTL
jgi:hypothetical protein